MPEHKSGKEGMYCATTWSRWWLRQNERTEKAEKLRTPSEAQDQIEPQIGI